MLNTYQLSRAHDTEGESPPSRTRLARLSRLRRPCGRLPTGGGSRESQACRAETAGPPLPRSGLRLAVSRDPIRATAVLTACLTGGACKQGLVARPGGVTGWPPSPRFPGSGSSRRASESGRSRSEPEPSRLRPAAAFRALATRLLTGDHDRVTDKPARAGAKPASGVSFPAAARQEDGRRWRPPTGRRRVRAASSRPVT